MKNIKFPKSLCWMNNGKLFRVRLWYEFSTFWREKSCMLVVFWGNLKFHFQLFCEAEANVNWAEHSMPSYTLVQIHSSWFNLDSVFFALFSNSVFVVAKGNSINFAIQSNHSFAKCSFSLQVLELTDALAVNSTAVRLEWHLLLSDTEYYIEVIHRNNLIDFTIGISRTFILSENCDWSGISFQLETLLFFLKFKQKIVIPIWNEFQNSKFRKFQNLTRSFIKLSLTLTLHSIFTFCDIQQGLYIRYRDLNSDAQKFSSVTVMKPDSEMADIANLNKFSKYEFFISPFYRSVEGQPSNSKIVQTLEDGEFDFLFFIREDFFFSLSFLN